MHEKRHFLSYRERRHDAENHLHILSALRHSGESLQKWPVGLVTGFCHSVFFSWLALCFSSYIVHLRCTSVGVGGGGW